MLVVVTAVLQQVACISVFPRSALPCKLSSTHGCNSSAMALESLHYICIFLQNKLCDLHTGGAVQVYQVLLLASPASLASCITKLKAMHDVCYHAVHDD